MFSMDKILLEFVGQNWMTLYITITLLKGIAILTPNVHDDQIITLFSNVYNALRGGRAPDRMT